uniref:DUF8039 domain-containing protein n=1 Tax=Tanacetum cinerariifolium TaxID=118510 RepID=A0A699H8I1_TANCI|nr:hypothetical protein [Tanacetum cinerariifolium]
MIRRHLIEHVFDKNYTCWDLYGETRDPQVDSQTFVSNTNHEENDSNDDNHRDNLDEMLHDAEINVDEKNAKKLQQLFVKAEKALYNGSFPKDNELPVLTYQAKKLTRSMGLEVQRTHTCPNDCILYRKAYKDLHECPICMESRLKKLYANPKDAKLLRRHAEERKNDGKIRHVADSPQWKNINRYFKKFRYEIKNIRFRLCSDGINPFKSLSSHHSTWPVLLCIYNLPPWLCMKRKYTMMSLLIQGPKQPGNDTDVYLRPLIDDMIDLWEKGVEIYDAYKKERFQLFAMIYCTINDFPPYGNLSGYGTKGRSFLGLLLNIPGKTKDGVNARKDVVEMGIRNDLAPQVPFGYSANIKNLVSMKDLKLLDKVIRMSSTNVDADMIQLGYHPCRVLQYQGYDINGYTFYTEQQDDKSTVQNSRVTLIATTIDSWRMTIAKNSTLPNQEQEEESIESKIFRNCMRKPVNKEKHISRHRLGPKGYRGFEQQWQKERNDPDKAIELHLIPDIRGSNYCFAWAPRNKNGIKTLPLELINVSNNLVQATRELAQGSNESKAEVDPSYWCWDQSTGDAPGEGRNNKVNRMSRFQQGKLMSQARSNLSSTTRIIREEHQGEQNESISTRQVDVPSSIHRRSSLISTTSIVKLPCIQEETYYCLYIPSSILAGEKVACATTTVYPIGYGTVHFKKLLKGHMKVSVIKVVKIHKSMELPVPDDEIPNLESAVKGFIQWPIAAIAHFTGMSKTPLSGVQTKRVMPQHENTPSTKKEKGNETTKEPNKQDKALEETSKHQQMIQKIDEVKERVKKEKAGNKKSLQALEDEVLSNRPRSVIDGYNKWMSRGDYAKPYAISVNKKGVGIPSCESLAEGLGVWILCPEMDA